MFQNALVRHLQHPEESSNFVADCHFRNNEASLDLDEVARWNCSPFEDAKDTSGTRRGADRVLHSNLDVNTAQEVALLVCSFLVRAEDPIDTPYCTDSIIEHEEPD